ncbi:putative ABC transport system ATP-binding protein [Granulicatella balaenopterae]|uniref:Putative hemin import ATP-binding protein HrtA n=1 Tax=Granulicatella balaenopterae TaxID=137733 RepID=A0A1H9PER4_9LACT|nr:ABC transporter ATP-binding protein [Granulicatella balaenopterae]SER46319.1 putative ABC transport system ATP-binding protein [Granulicatella balaenopterae]
MSVVKFEQVSKDYSDGVEVIHALQPATFEINQGELVAVIGPSGSGKSTMLTLMGGLQEPTGGKIYFQDKDFATMSKKEQIKMRFTNIGFILQASNLVPYLSVQDQFLFLDKYAGKTTNNKKLAELMDYMDIKKRKDLYPSELSGGERQRVAIARAIYNEPSLILADEPTASLDTQKAMKVVALLQKLTHESNRATVMVTHDERLIDYCDRVFRIIDGKLSEVTNEYKD